MNTARLMGHQIVSGISDGLEKDMKLDEYCKMAQRIAYLSGADSVVCKKKHGKVLEVEGISGERGITIRYCYPKDAIGARFLSRDGKPVCGRGGDALVFIDRNDCFDYIIADAAYTLRMWVDEA